MPCCGSRPADFDGLEGLLDVQERCWSSRMAARRGPEDGSAVISPPAALLPGRWSLGFRQRAGEARLQDGDQSPNGTSTSRLGGDGAVLARVRVEGVCAGEIVAGRILAGFGGAYTEGLTVPRRNRCAGGRRS